MITSTTPALIHCFPCRMCRRLPSTLPTQCLLSWLYRVWRCLLKSIKLGTTLPSSPSLQLMRQREPTLWHSSRTMFSRSTPRLKQRRQAKKATKATKPANTRHIRALRTGQLKALQNKQSCLKRLEMSRRRHIVAHWHSITLIQRRMNMTLNLVILRMPFLIQICHLTTHWCASLTLHHGSSGLVQAQ